MSLRVVIEMFISYFNVKGFETNKPANESLLIIFKMKITTCGYKCYSTRRFLTNDPNCNVKKLSNNVLINSFF